MHGEILLRIERHAAVPADDLRANRALRLRRRVLHHVRIRNANGEPCPRTVAAQIADLPAARFLMVPARIRARRHVDRAFSGDHVHALHAADARADDIDVAGMALYDDTVAHDGACRLLHRRRIAARIGTTRVIGRRPHPTAVGAARHPPDRVTRTRAS